MRHVPYVYGGLIAAMIFFVPLWDWRHAQTDTRNFRVVRPDVLYRSGQMTLTGLQKVVHDYGIKTVVTLRDTADEEGEPPDLAEERYCKAQEFNHVRIPPRSWDAPDG